MPKTAEQRAKRAEEMRRWRASKPGYVSAENKRREEYRRQWRQGAHKEQHLANRRKRYQSVDRNRYLKRTYGIDISEYDRLFNEQERRCAICRCDTPPKRNGDSVHWHIDHCHETGRVRGILCYKCNMAIGHLNDDPDLMRSAANYVEKHK